MVTRCRGSYCGSEAPQAVATMGPMRVTLTTDGSMAKEGFRLDWVTHDCGGNLTEEGEIRWPRHLLGPRSPVVRGAHFHNSNCTWTITAPPGKVVEIK